jgi:hypothetical protein
MDINSPEYLLQRIHQGPPAISSPHEMTKYSPPNPADPLRRMLFAE